MPFIEPDGIIVVCDGSKALVLVNEGSAAIPNLVVHHKTEIENPPARDLGADRGGRGHSSATGRTTAFAPTDFHRAAEDAFVGALAEWLERRTSGDAPVILVAPPAALAVLRERISGALRSRILAEIDKTLTKHPVDEIATLVAAELARRA